MPTPEEVQQEWAAWRADGWAKFPYERLQVPGAEALATWRALKIAGRGVPVVLGDDDAFDEVLTYLYDGRTKSWMSKDQVLAKAKANLEAAAMLRHPEDLRASIERQVGAVIEPPPLGTWPAGGFPPTSDSLGLTIALDHDSDEPRPMVHIALVPAREAAEIPAYLNYGPYGNCPLPEYHVAALRSWSRRYGAQLVGLGNMMNLRVARPPAGRAEALELAREHYDFCPDVFDLSEITLSDMAFQLQSERWWSFVWVD
jgi:hypothetical protein